jgi:hypothetical protein
MLKRIIRRIKIEYTITERIHTTHGAFWDMDERREVRQQLEDSSYEPL